MKIKTIVPLLIVCVLVLGVIIAVKNPKAQMPVINVKEYSLLTVPGDTVDTNTLINVTGKGEYDIKCGIEYGSESGDLDENGILHILDNGQSAMNTIILEFVVTGGEKEVSI